MKTFAIHTSLAPLSGLACRYDWLQLPNGNYFIAFEFQSLEQEDAMVAAGVTVLPAIVDPDSQVGAAVVAMLPAAANVLPTDKAYACAMKMFRHTRFPPHHPAR